MLTTVVLVCVAIFAVVIFLTAGADAEGRRIRAMKTLADLMGGRVEKLEEQGNSFVVRFEYKGVPFIYEDIEEKGFGDQPFRRGLLKHQTASNLTMGFSERDMGAVKETVTSFADVHTPWVQNIGKVIVPPPLAKFSIFTNNATLANQLLADEQILKIFEKFKNMDSRGHPVMSLEVFEGVVQIKFHSTGGIKPSLFSLHNNVSSIDTYLDKIILVAEQIEKIQKEMKEKNL